MIDKAIGELLFPGDYIATSEEFIPGEGTFEEDGRIYAAVIGKLNINMSEMMAEVVSQVEPPVHLKRGDIVLGRVVRIVKGYVFVEINHKKGTDREIVGETYARLHISNFSPSYIKDANQAFSENDIVRAEVIRTKPSLEISTSNDKLGIIKSVCHSCGDTLQGEQGKLVCKICNIVLRRKTSDDYGTWMF